MNLIFSEHAKLRLKGREISMEMVKRVVENPNLTDTDYYDEDIIHFFGKIDERVLRVICKPQGGYIFIITAFFDRNMKGKL